MIADISCYDSTTITRVDDDPSVSKEDAVCGEATFHAQDYVTCSAMKGCDGCVTTMKSDGSSCLWLDGFGEGMCANEGGMLGPGSTTCADSVVDAVVEKPEIGEDPCWSTELQCDECIAQGCAWTGSCLPACNMIADISCYDSTTITRVDDDPSVSKEDAVCGEATFHAQDYVTCSAMKGCDGCVTTMKSDGSSCLWLDGFGEGMCANEGGMLGPGSTTCADSVVDVVIGQPVDIEIDCFDQGTNCERCLSNGCSWLGSCLSSCDIISEPADCVGPPEGGGDLTAAIQSSCNQVLSNADDEALCRNNSADCTTCTITMKSDGTSCLWMELGESDPFNSFCAHRGGELGEGTDTCIIIDGPIVVDPSPENSSSQPNDKDKAICAAKNSKGCEACAMSEISNGKFCLWFGDMEPPLCAPISEGDMGVGYDMCAIKVVDPATMAPTESPTISFPPTESPTIAPVDRPTVPPTESPTMSPVDPPTESPIESPTMAPVDLPTESPVDSPTMAPLDPQTVSPVNSPTKAPVDLPTVAPVNLPTLAPTDAPTESPVEDGTVDKIDTSSGRRISCCSWFGNAIVASSVIYYMNN